MVDLPKRCPVLEVDKKCSLVVEKGQMVLSYGGTDKKLFSFAYIVKKMLSFARIGKKGSLLLRVANDVFTSFLIICLFLQLNTELWLVVVCLISTSLLI